MPTLEDIGTAETGYRQSAANVLKDRAMRHRRQADALALLADLVEKNVKPDTEEEKNLWSWAVGVK